MEIILNRKTKAGRKIVIKESIAEKAVNVIKVLERDLKYASTLERSSLKKKIEAWKKKLV